MANEKKRHGETDALQVRRVGHRHCVVTPPRRSEVVDVNTWINRVEKLDGQIRNAERSRDQANAAITALTAEREQIRGLLLAFETLPVDRVEGDPDVPLDAPQPEAVPVPASPATPEPQREPGPGRRG